MVGRFIAVGIGSVLACYGMSQIGSTAISGRVDRSLFSGSVTILSSQKLSVVAAANGDYSSAITKNRAEVVLLTTGTKLRGLAVAGLGGAVPINAESTALGLLMLAPGIGTNNIAHAKAQVSRLKLLPGFAGFKSVLQTNLKVKTLSDLRSSVAFQTAWRKCFTDYAARVGGYGRVEVKDAWLSEDAGFWVNWQATDPTFRSTAYQVINSAGVPLVPVTLGYGSGLDLLRSPHLWFNPPVLATSSAKVAMPTSSKAVRVWFHALGFGADVLPPGGLPATVSTKLFDNGMYYGAWGQCFLASALGMLNAEGTAWFPGSTQAHFEAGGEVFNGLYPLSTAELTALRSAMAARSRVNGEKALQALTLNYLQDLPGVLAKPIVKAKVAAAIGAPAAARWSAHTKAISGIVGLHDLCSAAMLGLAWEKLPRVSYKDVPFINSLYRGVWEGKFSGTTKLGGYLITGRFRGTIDRFGNVTGRAVDRYGSWTVDGRVDTAGKVYLRVLEDGNVALKLSGLFKVDSAGKGTGSGTWDQASGVGTWSGLRPKTFHKFSGFYDGPITGTVGATGEYIAKSWLGYVDSAGSFWGTILLGGSDNQWVGQIVTNDYVEASFPFLDLIKLAGKFSGTGSARVVSGTLKSASLTGKWSGKVK